MVIGVVDACNVTNGIVVGFTNSNRFALVHVACRCSSSKMDALCFAIQCEEVGVRERIVAIAVEGSAVKLVHRNLCRSKQTVGIIDVTVCPAYETTISVSIGSEQLTREDTVRNVQRCRALVQSYKTGMGTIGQRLEGAGDEGRAGTILNVGRVVGVSSDASSKLRTCSDSTGDIEVFDGGTAQILEWRAVLSSGRQVERHGMAVTIEHALETVAGAITCHGGDGNVAGQLIVFVQEGASTLRHILCKEVPVVSILDEIRSSLRTITFCEGLNDFKVLRVCSRVAVDTCYGQGVVACRLNGGWGRGNGIVCTQRQRVINAGNGRKHRDNATIIYIIGLNATDGNRHPEINTQHGNGL